MKKIILIASILLIGTIAFGQTKNEFESTKLDSLSQKEIYRIEVAEFQRLELIELKNGEFKGDLIHSVWKTNRKEEQKKKIVQKIKVPEKMVKKLMAELRNDGFENLKDCNEIEDCIVGLDGTTITFSFLKNGVNKSASYWELESDYYYKTNSVQLPLEVLEARKIFGIVNQEIDLKKQFENFTSRLPIGKYMFNGIIMERKR
ncbi:MULTISPECIES: hypothetical protein [Polaribacter]|uniref:Uncharacterized protein n=1 Tax=Polaribacter sejongensis TaxID=985043 RepID=A0AAJ1VH08_9FLAO|nr:MULTISPECIES: hypothetical protein [Polaribacter]AUC23225.1 hypothetical protein BTO15_14480 [Polaribacter sejongensis]MDN3620171.1 hypothetical protein [Polaribacter undariae]UWD32573.1 hypothetical protein NQP51_02615 [Polaribacter undariae]